MSATIDLVITTCERLPLLRRTLAHIWERTTTPYRLQVIDDASTEGNAEYLRELEAEGRIARAQLHSRRVGIPAHLRALEQITRSDPMVFSDDDILCPRLAPDWLARGLEAMRRYPELGMLALNNPQCNIGDRRGRMEPAEGVTFCRNIGGSLAFVRRAVLASCRPADGTKSAVKAMCHMAIERGRRVGYMTEVYCQHIGTISARNGRDLEGEMARVLPLDDDTLEPPDAYRS